MRIKITVMYDGTDYCGWQIQPNQISVQGEIAKAVFKLTGEKTEVCASGRTDAGVHALAQIAHFDLTKNFDVNKICKGLNFYLKPSIRVISAKRVKTDFNARFDASRKTYQYRMYISEFDNPLLLNRALRIDNVDIELMKMAAAEFVGKHDFVCFKSSGSDTKTSIRTVFESKITKTKNEVIFSITADGFLYNMVRKIIGTILAVGSGKRELSSIKQSLNPPFNQVKENAPPYALYLLNVKYNHKK